MKIARIITHDNQIRYGIFDPGQPDRVRLIEGDLFGGFRITEATATIRRMLPPVDPPNILAVGLNYRKHADETGIRYPDLPVLFIKATTSLAGPGEPILLPAAGPDEVDFEGELAIVIGRKGKNIPPERAFEHIFGYTCANDVSARDWQTRLQKQQWARGKSFDTFCPVGPVVVTTEEIPEPDRLRITTAVNGRILQDSNTADMIFDVATTVSNLSRSMTLLPGTLILTGTPEGVGFTRKPPVFLRKGDVVTVSIQGIGELTNRVEMEA